MADTCAAALSERDWPGDDILAGQLDTAAAGASLSLRPLPVALEELAMLLEGDPAFGGGRIDRVTGVC